MFIGLPSGLSWLAWASEQKVVTIDGITEDFAYFSCVKVQNKDVCHGCWNSTEFIYDAQGLYCPRNKDFECTKSITPQMVINEIDKIL